jgi:hypothetical protein
MLRELSMDKDIAFDQLNGFTSQMRVAAVAGDTTALLTLREEAETVLRNEIWPRLLRAHGLRASGIRQENNGLVLQLDGGGAVRVALEIVEGEDAGRHDDAEADGAWQFTVDMERRFGFRNPQQAARAGIHRRARQIATRIFFDEAASTNEAVIRAAMEFFRRSIPGSGVRAQGSTAFCALAQKVGAELGISVTVRVQAARPQGSRHDAPEPGLVA